MAQQVGASERVEGLVLSVQASKDGQSVAMPPVMGKHGAVRLSA